MIRQQLPKFLDQLLPWEIIKRWNLTKPSILWKKSSFKPPKTNVEPKNYPLEKEETSTKFLIFAVPA